MAIDGDFAGNGQPATTVLLADDQALARQEFRNSLERASWIEVVGEAADGKEAVRLVGELAPDVVLMDVRMPKMNGIEATREIVALRPEVKVIGLSLHREPELRDAMLEAGAVSYLLKDDGRRKLIEAIWTAVAE